METTTIQTENLRVRHRVNFSTSVKGNVTCDVTAELVNSTKEEVIKEAGDLLVLAQQVCKEKSLIT